MARITAKFRINRTAYQQMFAVGGTIHEKAQQTGQLAFKLAKQRAPRRTGHLADSHVFDGVSKTGRYECEFSITNRAFYASFVHEGTRTPIVPLHGPYMLVPAFPGSSVTVERRRVRGQDPTPWMREANEDAFRIMGGR